MTRADADFDAAAIGRHDVVDDEVALGVAEFVDFAMTPSMVMPCTPNPMRNSTMVVMLARSMLPSGANGVGAMV
jgi:hypothetical protein